MLSAAFSVCVPLPVDLNGEIHLFGRTDYPPGTNHLSLDDTQKWMKLKGFPVDEHMRGQRMVYSKGMCKLIACGGQKQGEFTGSWEDSDAIWICDVRSRLKREHPLKMLYRVPHRNTSGLL